MPPKVKIVGPETSLTAARCELDASADGSVSLRARAAIWKALAGASDPTTAYTRRDRLNQACVRHVRHRWVERFPDDDGIDRMLDLASGVVAETVDAPAASDARDRFYVDVVETRTYGSDASAMFVGLAAANTVLEALTPDNLDAIPTVDDDENLDPQGYDTSYLCASAAARGLNERPADIAQRRSFWRWYLDDAIPEIYQLREGSGS
jgi:hypothetical protein